MDVLGSKLELARATDQARRLDTRGVQAAAQGGDAEEAAQEMERLFATMLVKELRSALPNGLFGDGPGNDTYSAWFDEHLGASLAESGTLDLVGRIKASLGTPAESVAPDAPDQAPERAQSSRSVGDAARAARAPGRTNGDPA